MRFPRPGQPDRSDNSREIKVLIDHVQKLIRRVFGPDEDVTEIRIQASPFRMIVTTDHGGRFTVDTEPSVN